MNCQLVNDYMLDYCDGVLPPDLTIQIDDHIQGCKQCKNNYNLTLIENEVLASPLGNDLSSDLNNNIINIIKNLPEQYTNNQIIENKKTNKSYYLATLAVAAVLLLMIVITPSSIFDNIRVANLDSSKPEINIAKTEENHGFRIQALADPSKEAIDALEGTGNMSYVPNSSNDTMNDSDESSVGILYKDNTAVAERNINIVNIPTPPTLVLDYQIIETIDDISYQQYVYSNTQTIFNLFITQDSVRSQALFKLHSNSYSWSFIYNDIPYKATINSTLEASELEKIASHISF